MCGPLLFPNGHHNERSTKTGMIPEVRELVSGVDKTDIYIYTYKHMYVYIYIYWLVVWNMFYFPFHIWVVILPIDEVHHFSEG